MSESKKLSTRVSDEVYERLEMLAESSGTNISEATRMTLEKALNGKEASVEVQQLVPVKEMMKELEKSLFGLKQIEVLLKALAHFSQQQEERGKEFVALFQEAVSACFHKEFGSAKVEISSMSENLNKNSENLKRIESATNATYKIFKHDNDDIWSIKNIKIYAVISFIVISIFCIGWTLGKRESKVMVNFDEEIYNDFQESIRAEMEKFYQEKKSNGNQGGVKNEKGGKKKP